MGDEEELECPRCGRTVTREQGKTDMKTGDLLCHPCFQQLNQTSLPIRNPKRDKKDKVCPNCHTKTTTLWRKFKSADEIEKTCAKNMKIKDPKSVDRTRNDLEGKLGCNACTLYWKLHGVRIVVKLFFVLKSEECKN